MSESKINIFLSEEGIPFESNVDLKTKTLIKRGGIARYWIQPSTIERLETLIKWCQINNILFEIIGNTSNCYFTNSYNPFLVISTLKLKGFAVENDTLICESGYSMARLARYCNSNGFIGYEGFIGLPGTVAGAAVNNAGCYGSLTANLVKEVTVMENGVKKKLKNIELGYAHRYSKLKTKEIKAVILTVTFDIGQKGDAAELQKRAQQFQQHRKTFQEHTYPNLGSIFCKWKFKRLPLHLDIVYKAISVLIIAFVRDKVKKQHLRTGLLLYFRKAGYLKNYVSPHNSNCFLWKDNKADAAFIDYVEFINKNTSKAVMEIEIKT